jgi:hypothetical protein
MGFCQLTLNKLVTLLDWGKCNELSLGIYHDARLSKSDHLDLKGLARALEHRAFVHSHIWFKELSWHSVGEFLDHPYVNVENIRFTPFTWSVDDVDRFFDRISLNCCIEDLGFESHTTEAIEKELIEAVARGVPRCPSLRRFTLYDRNTFIAKEQFSNILERMKRGRGLLAACIPATLVHKRKNPWLPVELLKRVYDCIYRGM